MEEVRWAELGGFSWRKLTQASHFHKLSSSFIPLVITLSSRFFSCCLALGRWSGLNPKIHTHLEPQNVTLFGNRVFADITKVRIENILDEGGP